MQLLTINLDSVADAPWRTSVNVASPGYKPPCLDESSAYVNIVASLERDGQLAPIHVRPIGNDKYEIIDGHYVVEAARQLGMDSLQAVLHDLDDTAAQLLHIHFNLDRAFQYHVKIMRLFKTVPGDNEIKLATLRKCVAWPTDRLSDYVEADENSWNWKYFMENSVKKFNKKTGKMERLNEKEGDRIVTDWG
jgi:hypothetical protein